MGREAAEKWQMGKCATSKKTLGNKPLSAPQVPGKIENHGKQERTDFLRNGCFSAREHPRAAYCKLPTASGKGIPPGQAFYQSSTHRPHCSVPALLLLESSPFR